jgi:acetyl-CoA acyltransferase 1
MTATLAYEMMRRGKRARFGVVSMCIGSGMGAAAVFEAGDAGSGGVVPSVYLNEGLSRDAVV